MAASSPLWMSVLAASTTVEKNGCAQQGAAHLLEHDAELDVGEPRAAVLLRHVESLEAHLLGHLRPDGGVIAVLGLHLLAHGRLGALGVEERAYGAAQLVLFLGEGEVHAPMFAALARRVATLLVYTCVHNDLIRALRADLAAAVRRAADGERIVVTVSGRPTAQLGPLDDQAPDLDRLIAAGAVLPPRRRGPWRPPSQSPCGPASASTASSSSCGADGDGRPRHQRAAGRGDRRAPARRRSRRPRRRLDVERVGAGVDGGAAGPRPADRRAGAAARPGGRDPVGVGSPARRAGRPALP